LTIQNPVPCAIAQGDSNLNGAWLSQTNRGQHRFGVSWIIPTGGTLHRFDLFWHYNRYTNPVSLTVGANLGSTIPGTLDDKPYWKPASVGLFLGTTLFMNHCVAFQFNLSKSLSLPPWSEKKRIFQNADAF